MASPSVIYKCNECGRRYSRQPIGKCGKCGAFQNFSEVVESYGSTSPISSAGFKSTGAKRPVKRAKTLSDISSSPIERFVTGIGELDRVLGGGFVDAEVVLFSGAPGSGKSSLSLLVAEKVANAGRNVLYSSGEESEQQIGLRAKRMNVTNDLIKITNETNLESLLGHIEDEKPSFVIVDSIQTLASDGVNGSMGSISQSKEVAHRLTTLAKQTGVTMILISQVVKSGDFSGSESIQHIVDATLMLESDKDSPLKFLRAIKNRFGSTTEVGVFQHADEGLIEVSDPSGIMYDEDGGSTHSGTAVTFISEGVRQIPVEIQSLVSTSNLPTPTRQFTGIDFGRGRIVCAILDKFCKAKLYTSDVFVNTVSGLKVNDPMADLAIALAMYSSLKDKATKERIAVVGELSLTGRVRGHSMIQEKVSEAERLGFDKIILPSRAKGSVGRGHKIRIEYVSSVDEIIRLLDISS